MDATLVEVKAEVEADQEGATGEGVVIQRADIEGVPQVKAGAD